MNNRKDRSMVKFIIGSLIGVFLFMVPIPVAHYVEVVPDDYGYTITEEGAVYADEDAEAAPYEEGAPSEPVYERVYAFNIPLGFVIEWVGLAINSVQVNGFGLLFLAASVLITISFIGTLLAYTLKPAFIMNSPKLKNLFHCHPVYFVSKTIGAVLAWLVFFRASIEVYVPGAYVAGVYEEAHYRNLLEWLVGWDGARLMMDLIAGGSSGSNLMSIFIIIGITIPVLTDFGMMEFLGILIKKAVRFLFTLPGRSSVDLLSSWFSSSAAGIIITRDQHEKGFYTDREAAAICVNFALVSLPFTFVIASTVGLSGHFPLFYLVICIVALFLAIFMPRIWPLNKIKDEYIAGVGKQIDEEIPEGRSMFNWAVDSAAKRAAKTSIVDVGRIGVSNWLNIFMDLIPVILAWGTIALIVNYQTPVFEWLSLPFAFMLEILRVPGAFEYAPATIVGFIDMYVPALLLGSETYFETRFILGALSVVQIIYMAETGILILKSKIPLNIGHLVIIFLMRTVIALPIIVLLTRLIYGF